MDKKAANRDSVSQFFKTDGGKTESNAIETPSIALPKGGGAIKGIDEKFSVNAVNGTASFSIPLPFSPARGVSPVLNLTYNSGAGNSAFGLGWGLNLPFIKRKTDKKLPRYLDDIDSDTFLFSGAEDLVPEFKKEEDGSLSKGVDGNYIVNEKNSPDNNHTIRFYKPRIEGLFARIERWTDNTSKEIKWRVISRENVTTLFGWSAQSRISDPKDSRKIFQWLPEFVFDDKGNCAHYIYKNEDGAGFDHSLLHHRNRFENGDITYTNRYLEKVLYGNKMPYPTSDGPFPQETGYFFQTVFDYGPYDADVPQQVNTWDLREDAFSEYKAGFEIRTTRLCKRVLLFHFFDELPGDSALVQSTNFQYDTSGEGGITFLKGVTHHGYIKQDDGTYTRKNLPPMEFDYQKHDWNKEIKNISPENLVHAPGGLDPTRYQFIDLFNEGLSGILTEQGGGWFYKHNLGDGKFEPAKPVSPKPSFVGIGSGLQLMDLDADGGKQLVGMSTEPRGYFELNDEDQWQGFQTFDNLPNIDMGDADTRILDLDGDGKPEVLITEDFVFTWYESAGRKGFERVHKTPKPFDEEAGPAVVFSDPKETVYLADMSGDGLTDIVRIRNGEVCYWPNLGYGKFGAKVGMDRAPLFDHPDSFNPAYLKLADIDGSGTTDIIYLGKNSFNCWMNLNGNAFGAVPFEIGAFPGVHPGANITVTDLLGNGVPCIVWSSGLPKDSAAPLKYIDLMNGKKPHILISYKNNLGKEVSLEYTPSTRFYIEDKLSGNPWVTKLHFPVHCISKTETRDRITGYRFVGTYKYHHGYFDHAEREFRGFGMVEQCDAEHFDHWVKGEAGNIVDRELHQEPVFTKSWFHTGAFLNREKILNQFAREYWYEEMARRGFTAANNEKPLAETRLITAPGLDGSIIDELSADEWREALRACKGMPLRSEVFAKDAPLDGADDDEIEKELTPYSVSTQNCVIELVQPRGQNSHAVFVVKESEALTYSYERNTADPRISHNLNIKLDRYGNVLESATVVYPRLSGAVLQAQEKTNIIYTQNVFTDDVKGDDAMGTDDYRLRLPSEVKAYELKGVSKTGPFYSVPDFENILGGSIDVAYHQVDAEPSTGFSQKRLIEHTRTLYYNNDLSGPLDLHRLGARGLPFESYQLAFTPDLINDIYETGIDDTLMAEGKFIHFKEGENEYDDNWWIPSGTIRFIDETAVNPLDRFCSPIAYIDPYGAETKVKYYSDYFLFIDETEDAIGNKVSVEQFDFRTLSPRRTKDANDNISEAVTDELGMVKAVALLGKGGEADDLDGINEYSTAAENDLVAAFFNAPASDALAAAGKSLLQHATTRFVYDFDVYINSGKPVVTASISRETHFAEDNDSPVHPAFEYSNGLGGVVMQKAQAEPGPAKQVIVNPDNTYTVSEIDTSAPPPGQPEQPRWIGNGRTVPNNKGNPVKQYEPYFSVTHRYEDLEELVETGVTPILYYDAMGRRIKTEFPDNTFSKVEFDSWKQVSYDQNDTVEDSRWYIDRINNDIDDQLTAAGKDPAKEKEAAQKAAKHHGTPTVLHLDTLGRPVLSIEHNRVPAANPDDPDNDEFYDTTVEIDIEGNTRKITDAAGKTVMEYKYDMLGNQVYQKSMDAGKRWVLNNVMGGPVRQWDERGHVFLFYYDLLQRPTEMKVEGGDGTVPLSNTYQKTVYGEDLPGDKQYNLRGRVFEFYDTAGKVTSPAYDFKGNLLESTRRFAKDYKHVVDWSGTDPDDKLETETFLTQTQYDALNRVIWSRTPDNSITEPGYNEAGLLETVAVTRAGEPKKEFVKAIDYDEKGRRRGILYGNDVSTRYRYDKETFRLLHLETKRENGKLLQDLYYTYDPVGNITEIEDKSIPQVFFDNVQIQPRSKYIHDPLYRLIEAEGKEHIGQHNPGVKDNYNDNPFLKSYSPGDPMQWRNYTQKYRYDAVGNIEQMRHIANGGDWTRDYEYETGNNRLKHTILGENGDNTYNYTHHPTHGFMTGMPHLQVMEWNFNDELQAVSRQLVTNGGTPETTYYVYDGEGQRVRKVTENQAAAGIEPTKKSERFYVGGIEIYREHSGTDSGLERTTLHIMDDTRRIAMVETRNNVNDGSPQKLVRFQFGNHLGSACLETDDGVNARIISYEEYHPFGTTSYRAVDKDIKAAAKRYRYTGKERDEESGFYYHGARYYAPWLGRWTAADPAGLVDGVNVFSYVGNAVISFVDESGTQAGEYTHTGGAGPGSPPEDDDFSEEELLRRREIRLKYKAQIAVSEAQVEYDKSLRENWIKEFQSRYSKSYEEALKIYNTQFSGPRARKSDPAQERTYLAWKRRQETILKGLGISVSSPLGGAAAGFYFAFIGSDVETATFFAASAQVLEAGMPVASGAIARHKTKKYIGHKRKTTYVATLALGFPLVVRETRKQMYERIAKARKEFLKKHAIAIIPPKVQKHHLATDKDPTYWTPLFVAMFASAGMTLQHRANMVRVVGHQGPHPPEYHQYIYLKLQTALIGKTSKAERKTAIQDKLRELKRDAQRKGSFINDLLTGN